MAFIKCQTLRKTTVSAASIAWMSTSYILADFESFLVERVSLINVNRTQPIPIKIKIAENGFVKKSATLPVDMSALRKYVSRRGPRIKPKMSGAIGNLAFNKM